MLGSKLPAFAIGEQLALGNAKQGVVRFKVVTHGEERLVGSDERDTARVGKFNERLLRRPLRRHPVALQFDVEPVAKQSLQLFAACDREGILSADDWNVERPVGAARQRNQSARRVLKPSQFDMRAIVLLGLEVRTRRQPHQAPVAVLAGGQQDKARPPVSGRGVTVFLIAKVDAQGASDDRLNTHARHFLGKLESAEHVVGVGESERRLAILLRKLGQSGDFQRAFEQRIRRMHMQMDEARLFCGGFIGGRHRARRSRLPILLIPEGERMSEGAPACPSPRRQQVPAAHRNFLPSLLLIGDPLTEGRWSSRSPAKLEDPENLGPYGDHRQEQGDRCQCKRLLDNRAEHCNALSVWNEKGT